MCVCMYVYIMSNNYRHMMTYFLLNIIELYPLVRATNDAHISWAIATISEWITTKNSAFINQIITF